MKKLVLVSAIVMSGIFYNTANAQIRFHLGVRFAPRPVYVEQPAPVVYDEQANYDGDDDYYYLPDVDAYYSVPEQCYYYNNGGAWVSASYLPGAYRDYDWSTARRYEIRASRPYMHADFYRNRYNGVAFSGRWDNRVYDNGGYANYDRHDRYYDNDRHFDDHGYGRYERDNRDYGRNDFHGRGWDNHERFGRGNDHWRDRF